MPVREFVKRLLGMYQPTEEEIQAREEKTQAKEERIRAKKLKKFHEILARCKKVEGRVKKVEIKRDTDFPHYVKVWLEDPILTDGELVQGCAACPEDRPIEVGQDYCFYLGGAPDNDLGNVYSSRRKAIITYNKVGEEPFVPYEYIDA